MLNKKALSLSIILTLVEITIFLLVSGSFSFKGLSEKLLPYIPNMFIALATTWYVIFTYFILKSNEMLRRISTEPFIHISWEISDEIEDHSFNKYSKLNEQMINTFNLHKIENGQKKRYVSLILQNLNQTKVGSIEMKIEIKVTLSTKEDWYSDIFKIKIDDINLGSTDSFPITVLDLQATPKSAKIDLKLNYIKYNPIDSPNTFISGKAGRDNYSCNGITEFEEKAPEPIIEKKGD